MVVLLLIAGTVAGLVLAPVLVGFPVLIGVLRGARAVGGMHRRLAGVLLGLQIPRPEPVTVKGGLGSWFVARLGDRAAWRSVAYLLVRLPVGLLGLVTCGALAVYGAAAVTYPVTWIIQPARELPMFAIQSETWLGTVVWCATGAVVLVALPGFVHAFAGVDRLLLRALVVDPGLRERVRYLEETRATALDDAAERLRRIERDLHDGAQAQLVAMAMKLGLAKEELGTETVDLDQVRLLVDAAHGNAKQALLELRDLARGIHPAALGNGLGLALSTLASSTRADVDVQLSRRPPPALETILYFAAAELMTNASKHGTGQCEVRIDDHHNKLRLTVADRGPGGAVLVPGGGLAGIVERLRPVDGELIVSSPAGGPTVVTAVLPLPD